MEDYLENLINPNNDLLKKVRKDYFIPPMDLLYDGLGLGSAENKVVYFGVMRYIISSCFAFNSYELALNKDCDIFQEIEDFNLKTFEDMYYYAIYILIKFFGPRKELK